MRALIYKSKEGASSKIVLKCITIAKNMEEDDHFGTNGDTRLLHLTIHGTNRALEFINSVEYLIGFKSITAQRTL